MVVCCQDWTSYSARACVPVPVICARRGGGERGTARGRFTRHGHAQERRTFSGRKPADAGVYVQVERSVCGWLGEGKKFVSTPSPYRRIADHRTLRQDIGGRVKRGDTCQLVPVRELGIRFLRNRRYSGNSGSPFLSLLGLSLYGFRNERLGARSLGLYRAKLQASFVWADTMAA